MQLFFSLLFLLLLPFSLCDPRTSLARLYCGTYRDQPYSDFIPKFVEEMYTLAQMINTQNWAFYKTNSTPTMYGLVQCYGDLSRTDCQLCYAAARTKIPSCIPSVSAVIHLDGCFLRYDNYSFYGNPLDPRIDTRNCNTSYGTVTAESLEFAQNVEEVIDKASGDASAMGGFGVAEVKGRLERVYALAQCWETVSANGCKACLKKAREEVKRCVPSREGRGLNAGCYLRYSTTKFDNNRNGTADRHGLHKLGDIIAIILASIAVFILFLSSIYLSYIRCSRWKQGENEVTRRLTKIGLKFKYEILEQATNFFDPSNKVGQGGAGIVFKGTLPNGQEVAVKRLFFNTRQWVDEFFNEVNLISSVQHHNLVKLLGCSIEGPESLLVYEFVPNMSLDHYIFDRSGNNSLSWKQRLNIIIGTAEGLAYLHGGTKTRIIHRDIKLSNVLLDEDFTPKIADFGLVRCFASGKTHLSTGIAGTLGYMAPEYLVRGQLTEKVDVYSYGVLVLEITCGRKNVFLEESKSLMQTVWNLYRLDRLTECIDPCLLNDFLWEEASKVLKIGLLCTQASVVLRPSMAHVVEMLTRENCKIPAPNQPPFLNTNLLDFEKILDFGW